MDQLTVRAFMTAGPHTIGVEQSLVTAHELMRRHRIRHLPVLHGGKLVGIVTERDLQVVEGLPGVDPARVTVEQAMTPTPYTITPDTSLEWVVLEMAEHKYGSTVVVEDGRVVGVFTTVDALRALEDLLRRTRQSMARRAHSHAAR
jgi:acetoin utilization protein AcuB